MFAQTPNLSFGDQQEQKMQLTSKKATLYSAKKRSENNSAMDTLPKVESSSNIQLPTI